MALFTLNGGLRGLGEDPVPLNLLDNIRQAATRKFAEAFQFSLAASNAHDAIGMALAQGIAASQAAMQLMEWYRQPPQRYQLIAAAQAGNIPAQDILNQAGVDWRPAPVTTATTFPAVTTAPTTTAAVTTTNTSNVPPAAGAVEIPYYPLTRAQQYAGMSREEKEAFIMFARGGNTRAQGLLDEAGVEWREKKPDSGLSNIPTPLLLAAGGLILLLVMGKK